MSNTSAAALDLSFPGFDRRSEVSRLPRDLSAAVADVATRQGVPPALRSDMRSGRTGHRSRLLHPLDCAFNGAVAMLLRARYLVDVDCWSEVKGQPIKPSTIRRVLLDKLNNPERTPLS